MKAIKKFFSQQRFLIVDDGASSRIAIARTLSELGVPASRMSLAGSYDSAQELVRRNTYTGLICEYEIGKVCGLELIKQLKGLKMTAIITKNQTEESQARAAEHDVDIFLRKPYTMDALRSALLGHFQPKNAHGIQTVAAENSGAVRGSIERVLSSHARAGQYDKLGYQALLGLYDALIAQKQKPDAYEVLKQMVLNFPVHPPRLLEVLRLAVETGKTDDIEDYYEIYLRLEDKTPELIKNVCAALVVSGKGFLKSKNVRRAVGAFKKAAITSGKKPAFLTLIIEALVDSGNPGEADGFLTHFPPDLKETDEFLALDYRVFSRLRPIHEVILRGRELIAKKHFHPQIYRCLIQATLLAGHISEAESLGMDAVRRWPAQSTEIQNLLAR